jgi:hypothetical protein
MSSPRRHRRTLARLLAAAAAGVAAAVLVSCGSSGKGLIPVANAGPLKSAFEEVEAAALSGGGDCTATEAALAKTLHAFEGLPPSVDRGLRDTLRQGIENLQKRAMQTCAQPSTTSTSTTSTQRRTTTTPTTSSTTTTTPTSPTTTTPPPATTTPPPAGQGGGTAAPGQEGAGQSEAGAGGGVGAGGVGPGEGGK